MHMTLSRKMQANTSIPQLLRKYDQQIADTSEGLEDKEKEEKSNVVINTHINRQFIWITDN